MQRDSARADRAQLWVKAPRLPHVWAPTGGQRLGAQLLRPSPPHHGRGEGGGLLSLPRPISQLWGPAAAHQPHDTLSQTPLICGGLKL